MQVEAIFVEKLLLISPKLVFAEHHSVVRENPQTCLDPPISEWHDGQRRMVSKKGVLE